MKIAGSRKLALHPETGYWFRALNLRHWDDRLNSDHSKTSRTRFNPAPPPGGLYRILYLGENHQVAIYEVGALLGDPNAPVSNAQGSWALMSLKIRLHHVANLSDPDQQELIGTNDQELTGGWVNSSGAAPTQILGAALFAIPKLEAFIYPSSKSGSRCLAIFMDKLHKRSLIEFRNELTNTTEKLH